MAVRSAIAVGGALFVGLLVGLPVLSDNTSPPSLQAQADPCPPRSPAGCSGSPVPAVPTTTIMDTGVAALPACPPRSPTGCTPKPVTTTTTATTAEPPPARPSTPQQQPVPVVAQPIPARVVPAPILRTSVVQAPAVPIPVATTTATTTTTTRTTTPPDSPPPVRAASLATDADDWGGLDGPFVPAIVVVVVAITGTIGIRAGH